MLPSVEMPERRDSQLAEIERLRAEVARLEAEVARLSAELRGVGRYVPEPVRAAAEDRAEGEIAWAYTRGDLYDDLGDD
jgi:hypothetical protein